jgi:hypothetical protein
MEQNMRKIVSLFILLAAIGLHAQTTTVTAIDVLNAQGATLASGVLCFQPVTTQAPTPYTPGTVVTLDGNYCGQIANGHLPAAGFPVVSSSWNNFYHVFSATAYPFTVLRDYGAVAIDGASWSLDTFTSYGSPGIVAATTPYLAVPTATAVVMAGGSLTLPSPPYAQSILIINSSPSTAITISTTSGQALNGTTVAANHGLLVWNYGGSENWFSVAYPANFPTTWTSQTTTSPYTVGSGDTLILQGGGSITLPTTSTAQTVFVLNTSTSSNLTVTAPGGNAEGAVIAPNAGAGFATFGTASDCNCTTWSIVY